MLATALVYVPGLGGGWLFDDYPNIADNAGIRMTELSLPSLVRAALSSPASDFKRPLASLSFALNYYVSGNDPASMKATNIVIHLLNGLLVYLVLRSLLPKLGGRRPDPDALVAAWISVAWMLLPINLTSVLYTVQRMESLANLAVLAGLLCYVNGRALSLTGKRRGLPMALGGVLLFTCVGALAKETAVLLPLYAVLIESLAFRFRRHDAADARIDRGVVAFFVIVLVLPFIAGMAWLLPGLLKASTWATRTFGMAERLFSETRIVVDYIAWTLAPTGRGLSFYHDDFRISTGWLSPPSTLASFIALAALASLAWATRRRLPLFSLGIALFFACHTLTATIIPLELIYEHRNYFASLGVLMAVAGLLESLQFKALSRPDWMRNGIAAVLLIAWGGTTWMSAYGWGEPLRLARTLAERAPQSPRAQYELGRMYIIASGYQPGSPFIQLAYAPLESAARLPDASILPEQALIFLNARMHLPVKDAWWASMIQKLRDKPPTIQDESSLESLSNCLADESCEFPTQHLHDAFVAALSHDGSTPRLLGMYADFAWRSLEDRPLAVRVARDAVARAPREPTYHVNLARYALGVGDIAEAHKQLTALRQLNVGGSLQGDIDDIEGRLARVSKACTSSPTADTACQAR